MTSTYDDTASTPIAIDSPSLLPDRQIVVMVWGTQNGPCHDCGLPAAFQETGLGHKLCSVCAADIAADGVPIERLNPT